MTDLETLWTPPASDVTRPDPLPADAWRAIDFIEGELPVQAWRTPRGFLVLTNLRCLALWRSFELFAPHTWRTGPEFFFYNLRAPQVVLDRFIELSEEFEEAGTVGRFAVRDPTAVAAAISAAQVTGRGLWEDRRRHAEDLIKARQRSRADRASGTTPLAVMVQCNYCGNFVNANLRRCPSCGAHIG